MDLIPDGFAFALFYAQRGTGGIFNNEDS